MGQMTDEEVKKLETYKYKPAVARKHAPRKVAAKNPTAAVVR
jgi:hypothetical protein